MLWVVLAVATVPRHGRVTSIPGMGVPNGTGTHYSGLLDVHDTAGGDLEVFYYYVQHPDPRAPLLVWMNGGPGASSLMGLFTELGPYLLNSRSVPTTEAGAWHLEANPHAWSREAALLVWEQPAGVGFSRCAGGLTCDLVWNDTTAADANLRFLRTFMAVHSDAAVRPLFISGESYAGVYVPMLGEAILAHNAASSAAARLLLRGVLVGNGCIGYGVTGGCGLDSLDLFLTSLERKAAGIPRPALAGARSACNGELDAGLQPSGLSAACGAALAAVFEEVGTYNEYHYGSPCGGDGQGNWGAGTGFACGSGALSSYLSRRETQRALHVITGNEPAREWRAWDGDSPLYNITATDVQPSYRALLAAGVSTLIYNGLLDTAVPAAGAEKWVPRVAGQALSASRRPWAAPTAPNYTAGHVTVYASGLTFATVIGAGHLVPADMPVPAQAMVEAFLAARPLPPYEGPRCKRLWLGRGYGEFCSGGGVVNASSREHKEGVESKKE